MPDFNRIPMQYPEDREPTRDSQVDACLCIVTVFVLGIVFIFCISSRFIFSPLQAMIDLSHQNMEIQLVNYCANRCCYSRYSNTFSTRYGFYSSNKIFKVPADYSCVQCPDQRHSDYHYDCNVASSTF